MCTINAGLKYQFEFNYQIVFSASFVKMDDDDQLLDERELYTKSKINQNLTQSVLKKVTFDSNLRDKCKIKRLKILVGDLIQIIQSHYVSIRLLNLM